MLQKIKDLKNIWLVIGLIAYSCLTIANAAQISVTFDQETLQTISDDRFLQQLTQTMEERLVLPDSKQLTFRPFNYQNADELAAVSSLICKNFRTRPEYTNFPSELIQLYLEANSTENLYQTMQKSGTIGFIAIDNDNCLQGVVVVRSNLTSLEIRRIHVAASTAYKGIGTSLVALCAFVAKTQRIPALVTTASMPARGFFEHLGWSGEVIETKFELASLGRTITLPQFKCFLEVS